MEVLKKAQVVLLQKLQDEIQEALLDQFQLSGEISGYIPGSYSQVITMQNTQQELLRHLRWDSCKDSRQISQREPRWNYWRYPSPGRTLERIPEKLMNNSRWFSNRNSKGNCQTNCGLKLHNSWKCYCAPQAIFTLGNILSLKCKLFCIKIYIIIFIIFTHEHV